MGWWLLKIIKFLTKKGPKCKDKIGQQKCKKYKEQGRCKKNKKNISIRKDCQKTCKVGKICTKKGTNSFLLKLNFQTKIASNLGVFFQNLMVHSQSIAY